MKIKFTFGIILLALFLSFSENMHAQAWSWAKSIGGTGNDYGRSIAVDPINGDIYTMGYFSYSTDSIDFDPGPGTYYLDLDFGTFISKLDSAGNFVWAKGITTYNNGGLSLALGPTGSEGVYFTGNFGITSDFDPGAGTYYLDGSGIFICKWDNSGNFVWAKKLGNSGFDSGQSIALDFSGNVYTTGSFYGTSDFDPGSNTFNLTSVGFIDIFVSKLDSSGNFVWAKSMGGESWYEYEDEIGYDIAIDSSGNVYTTGYFTGTADFDPGSGTFNLTALYYDIFISKLDSSGNFVWAVNIGGNEFDIGKSIAVDPQNGDVYTTGACYGTVDFDPGSGTFILIGSGMFICKLDSSGSFIWAKGFSTSGDGGYSIALNLTGSGGVYTTGVNNNSYTDFDPGPGTFYLFGPVFILKLDSSGNFGWAIGSGGASWGVGLSLALSNSNKVHVVGTFGSLEGPSIQFNCTTLLNHESVCYDDTGYGSLCYHNEIFIVQVDENAPPFNSLVTNTNDSGPGSLRDIISCSYHGDTVTFSLPPMSQITLTSGEIWVNKNLVISGPGMLNLTISGNLTSRIFDLYEYYIYGSKFVIENLSLKYANPPYGYVGGAMYVGGNLDLKNVLFQNNYENGVPIAMTISPEVLVTILGNVEIKN